MPPDPNALKRETAGRYTTADGRFAVEQESGGSWVLVDQEHADELGLPLVRGPFPTLAAARGAVADAREAPAPESPLAKRIREGRPAEVAGRTAASRPKSRRGAASTAPEPPPEPPSLTARAAAADDAEAIARIYNAGIGSRAATFETRPRTRADVLAWFDGRHPIVVVARGDEVVGFAASFEYSRREAYRGVAEFSVYVDPDRRREGAGRMAMEALVEAVTDAGFWKLVSLVFTAHEASRALLRSIGFREVGTYRRHARLDDEWRDCVIVERLVGEAAER